MGLSEDAKRVEKKKPVKKEAKVSPAIEETKEEPLSDGAKDLKKSKTSKDSIKKPKKWTDDNRLQAWNVENFNISKFTFQKQMI